MQIFIARLWSYGVNIMSIQYTSDVNKTKFLRPRWKEQDQDQDRCLQDQEQDQDQNNKTKTTGSKQVLGRFNF